MLTFVVRKVEEIALAPAAVARALPFFGRPRRALTTAITAALALILCALPCRAAGPPMTGTVTDALGRPLPGASIEVRSANDSSVFHHASPIMPAGSCFTPPRPGLYSLFAAKPGFHSANKVVV